MRQQRKRARNEMEMEEDLSPNAMSFPRFQLQQSPSGISGEFNQMSIEFQGKRSKLESPDQNYLPNF